MLRKREQRKSSMKAKQYHMKIKVSTAKNIPASNVFFFLRAQRDRTSSIEVFTLIVNNVLT